MAVHHQDSQGDEDVTIIETIDTTVTVTDDTTGDDVMVMLMEPIFAAFIGTWVGVSSLPGLITWAGDGVVMIGSFMVIRSGAKSRETIDATEAMQQYEAEEEQIPGTPKLLMRSPLIVKDKYEKKDMELGGFRRPRANSDAHRVIWSPGPSTLRKRRLGRQESY